MNGILRLSLVVIIGLMTACGSNEYMQEVATIDSLQIELDEAVLTYQQWDIDSLDAIHATMQKQINIAKDLIRAGRDTLSLEDGITLGDYKSSSKVFRDVKSKSVHFQSEIKVSESQLTNLKKDLQNGTIANKDSIKLYMDAEKEAVGQLIETLNQNNKKFELGMMKYEALYPKVTALLEELRNGYNN